MTTLPDDIRYSVRTLRKAPAFTLTAILTIALGIGACTAIFSVINAVLLRSLPYEEPERLVFVQSDLTSRDVTDYPMAPGDLPDLRRQITALQDAAAVITGRTVFTSDVGEPEQIVTANVTTNFFRTIGARFARGREFVDQDGAPMQMPAAAGPGQAAGAQPQTPPPPPPPAMVVLSNGFWQRRFGGDPNIIGKTFRMGQQTAEIVGVLEPGFELLWPKAANVQTKPDVYSAMRVDFATAARGSVSLRVFGRLRPGASVAQAQEQANATVAELRKRFPVKETAGLRWRIEPMQTYAVARVRPLLIALMGAVTFVLLIACANVANLLLVRGNQRERELTVRAALGSGRWPLMRQTLVESFALALAGAMVGVALAWAGIRVLIRMGPADLPRLEHVSLDPVVFAFAFAATMLAALLFGAVPALRASRVNVAETLRATGRSSGLAGVGRWLRQGVVISEVTLAFVLLVGSGLMIRSFMTMQRARPGFDTDGVLTFQIPNQNQGMQSFEAAMTFGRQIQERLRGIPGVVSASSSSSLPFDGGVGSVPWGTEAAAADPNLFQQADRRNVRAGYFNAMRTRVIEGREFTEADVQPDARVIVVDEVFARMAFPGTSAVGKRILVRNFSGGNDPHTVIGVVQHQRNLSPAEDSRQTLFQPGFATDRWIVRTSGDPTRTLQTVRSELRQLNPNLLVAEARPLLDLVDDARAHTRFALWCIVVFAAIAAVLASVGLYGVLATSVRIRTAEIGVRMALGATAQNIFGTVVRQGVSLSAVGIALGMLAAFWLTRLMTTLLVGVTPTDPTTYITIGVFFLTIATVACSIPALRASRVAPLIALREN
jgi:putative ABC transport system permease protein